MKYLQVFGFPDIYFFKRSLSRGNFNPILVMLGNENHTFIKSLALVSFVRILPTEVQSSLPATREAGIQTHSTITSSCKLSILCNTIKIQTNLHHPDLSFFYPRIEQLHERIQCLESDIPVGVMVLGVEVWRNLVKLHLLNTDISPPCQYNLLCNISNREIRGGKSCIKIFLSGSWYMVWRSGGT